MASLKFVNLNDLYIINIGGDTGYYYLAKYCKETDQYCQLETDEFNPDMVCSLSRNAMYTKTLNYLCTGAYRTGVVYHVPNLLLEGFSKDFYEYLKESQISAGRIQEWIAEIKKLTNESRVEDIKKALIAPIICSWGSNPNTNAHTSGSGNEHE